MFVNHRTTPRFNLKIPIRIRRIDQLGSTEYTVLSSNVSAGGAYFESELQLEPGTPVRMYFTVSEPIFAMPAARWCCEGRVIYTLLTHHEGYGRATGISFQTHRLVTGAPLESIEQPYNAIHRQSRQGLFPAAIRAPYPRAWLALVGWNVMPDQVRDRNL
jgi:hypothetical protein